MVKPSIHNVSTGIAEFDRILHGGFPNGSVILLSGQAGTGKTIFSFQWIFDGASNGESCVYITFTEPLFKTIRNLESLSFYNREHIENQRVSILDLRMYLEDHNFEIAGMIEYVEDLVKKNNAKRLCIDSITAILCVINDPRRIREFIFQLGRSLASLGCTVILTSEAPSQDAYSHFGVEEFIADAIIHLKQERTRYKLERTVQVFKVRGKSYSSCVSHFKIAENGINVYSRVRIPLIYPSTRERISTGSKAIDQMMHGGLLKGSTTFLAGTAGTGKSLLAMQFMIEGLKKDENCLYVGFEESRDQIIRNAESIGWKIQEYEKKGNLKLHCVYPSDKFIEEHLGDIKNIVESQNIQRCVIDSLSALLNSFQEDVFLSFAKAISRYLKSRGITSYFTSANDASIGNHTLTEGHLSTMADNLILLRYVEDKGKLSSIFNIVKMRGGSHDSNIKRYTFGKNGIRLGRAHTKKPQQAWH